MIDLAAPAVVKMGGRGSVFVFGEFLKFSPLRGSFIPESRALHNFSVGKPGEERPEKVG